MHHSSVEYSTRNLYLSARNAFKIFGAILIKPYERSNNNFVTDSSIITHICSSSLAQREKL